MKFRCPKCDQLFDATRGAGKARCPGCGEELSTRPRLKRTCPECGTQYPVERSTCPECGASYKLTTLQQQEASELGDDTGKGLTPAVRGCLAVAGIAMTVGGVILFAAALDAGWYVSFFVFLILGGPCLIYAGLKADNIAAKARAARRARRPHPPASP